MELTLGSPGIGWDEDDVAIKHTLSGGDCQEFAGVMNKGKNLHVGGGWYWVSSRLGWDSRCNVEVAVR